MEENLPPGFRFHPTDEELVTYYLMHKVSDVGFTAKAIVDVDLNKCEPWDLPGKASMGEKEWYFFSMRDRKYPTGLRTNRATEAGYWKTTGKDKEVVRAGVVVGMKKTLVFYKGRAPKGEKSNWVMHEYRLDNSNKNPFKPNKEEWVVCRVFQKSAAPKKPQEAQSSQPSLESPCDANSMANEFDDIELPNLNCMANSSSGFHSPHMNLTSGFSSSGLGESCMNLQQMHTNNMNLASMSLPSLSTLTSSILGSGLSPMNSLLLRALQLKNVYHQPIGSAADYPTLLHQHNIVSQFDVSGNLGSNLEAVSASSSKSVELQPHSQPLPQSHDPQPPPEQPFTMDSMW